MASAEKSNERRRRIMERGSDRLALITGQLKNLERTSSLPSAAPPSLSFTDRSEIHFDTPQATEVTSRKEYTVPKQVPKAEKFDSSNHTRLATTSDIKKPQAPPKIGQPPPPPSSSSSSSSKAKQQTTTFFSSRRLNACIIASEMPRAKCSTAIAVLVLLFHLIGINGGGCCEKYKPVYLIVVTSVTVVLVRMVQGKGTVVEDAGKEDKAAEDKNWRDAFMVLERGLTAYQAIRAMFIDCSIYFVIVISGLSMASSNS